MRPERFATAIGLLLALMGQAIGTGNIWRFPRVAALNGGGAFLIAYFIALFSWSIPLLILEFSCGKKYKKGVFAVFTEMLGPRFAWMGAFVAFCTLAIMCYYSVVLGWCLKYFMLSLSGGLFEADSGVIWTGFTAHPWQPLLFHGISMSLAAGILFLGIVKGIERTNLILIPSLFVMLILLVVLALRLPGSERGLEFLYSTDFSRLLAARTWVEALSQSAWSTGAGWGIVLTYAAYAREKERPVFNSVMTGFGDTAAAILAAMCVLPTLFSMLPQEEALNIAASGNTGLTFISLPHIFTEIPYGRFVASLFFLALIFAAFTSLIAMLELGVHQLRNFGLSREKAIGIVFLAGLVFGAPSALWLSFLNNQDWVWGLGLLFSGFFFSFLVHRFGAGRFASEILPLMFFPKVFLFVVKWIIPFEFIALLTWWGFQSIKENPAAWWQPFQSFGLGTCLLQWGLVFLLLVFGSRWLAGKIKPNETKS